MEVEWLYSFIINVLKTNVTLDVTDSCPNCANSLLLYSITIIIIIISKVRILCTE